MAALSNKYILPRGPKKGMCIGVRIIEMYMDLLEVGDLRGAEGSESREV